MPQSTKALNRLRNFDDVACARNQQVELHVAVIQDDHESVVNIVEVLYEDVSEEEYRKWEGGNDAKRPRTGKQQASKGPPIGAPSNRQPQQRKEPNLDDLADKVASRIQDSRHNSRLFLGCSSYAHFSL